MVHQQDEVRQSAELIEELEEYVKIKESYFVEQIVTKELLLTKLAEKHRQEQEKCVGSRGGHLCGRDHTTICLDRRTYVWEIRNSIRTERERHKEYRY